MSNSARAAFLAASSCLMLPLLAPAATGMRTAVVDGIEAESDNSTGTESIMYVQQSGSWSNSVSCQTGYAYFDSKANPHFVAMLLTARAQGLPLRVFVDDARPRMGGTICQVINLQY